MHNNSRVIPARLFGRNRRTGGEFEIFLLQENRRNDWWAMLKPGRRARVGTEIQLLERGELVETVAQVLEVNSEGHRRLFFRGTCNVLADLEKVGSVPLPPYISRLADKSDRERYQTIYAEKTGSVAAPTAGLHFTERLLGQLRNAGVGIHFVTLHVGLGTFAPVKVDNISDHVMHEEQFQLSAETASAINSARAAAKRVVAVGTTTLRVLESVAQKTGGALVKSSGKTSIFIWPPYNFRVADALLTNFHLPRSTLLMLVSAFAAPGSLRGRDLILNAYREGIRERYRFFSYGDAMLIL